MKPLKYINLGISWQLYEKLKSQALRSNRSVSGQLRYIVEQALERA